MPTEATVHCTVYPASGSILDISFLAPRVPGQHLNDLVMNQQQQLNDTILAGQILDTILAEDCGACRLIFDHDTTPRLFNIAKSYFFPKDVSQHPESFFLLMNCKQTNKRGSLERAKV